jgi:hypothetical protein
MGKVTDRASDWIDLTNRVLNNAFEEVSLDSTEHTSLVMAH